MTELYGWPAMWGCQSPSPYVTKAQITLEMLGVDYTMVFANLEEAPFGKAPYLKDDGNLVGDSELIRAYFEKKLGKDLDAGLTPEQKATAWSFTRMLELQMGPFLLSERWLNRANFDKGPLAFFQGVPEEAREGVIQDQIAKLRTNFEKNDVTKFSKDEMYAFARNSVDAVGNYLGDKTYFMGDEPSGVDATVYSFMASCGTDFFDSPMVEMIAAHENIGAYVKRMEERYFSEPRWIV